MKRVTYLLFVCFIMTLQLQAQEKLNFQQPPQEILELVDVERPPIVSLDSKDEKMLFYYRNPFKSLSDLKQSELKLGGLRINPDANISSTLTYYNDIRFKGLSDKAIRTIDGMPANARIAYSTYSPDESKMAFTNTTERGVELWVIDFSTGTANRLTDPILNANAGHPYAWFPSGDALLVRMLPGDRPQLITPEEALPDGPIITTSDGQISQNRTYQDLLKNATDEANFEMLLTAELYKVELDGKQTLWKEAGMYTNESFSPDGNFVLLRTLTHPFSYVVPYNSFPNRTDIYTVAGKLHTAIGEQPMLDNLPVGFMSTFEGRRNINWRSDKPATVYWTEALDGGDPERDAEFRDKMMQLEAPFESEPQLVAKTIGRYGGVVWGNDEHAILVDNWWKTRNIKMSLINPSDNTQQPRVLSDRSYQDIYSDPGSPQTKRNEFGRMVLQIEKDNIYLFGDGHSPEGQFPFIDQLNLKTLKTNRIYQSTYKDRVEELISITDIKKGTLLTRMESPTEYPNYYLRNIRSKKAPQALTAFPNPFKAFEGVHKEVINYTRADGVELSGTLYLPADYDRTSKEKLPMIMWAYPTEYKDRSSAGQSSANPNRFTFLSYGSPIYWVMRGYAVLNDAAFPILGEGDEEPNDTFVEQLVANAEAAINAVDELGYIDRKRVAVGGHSYGAFMTANLLSHSDLFAAGIARSGAYNRTLTPFGFQSEERSYWDVPQVYDKMSPFMHADKMKTPMLLIHGEVDNNSGTHTMQSERYFQALKSFGAPARLVILPLESHGYAAYENVLHLLWEQDQWLEQYVKNKED